MSLIKCVIMTLKTVVPGVVQHLSMGRIGYCVRAKVSLFHAKTEIIGEKRTQLEESEDLLELARSYLESL
jgi:hypothetical protein